MSTDKKKLKRRAEGGAGISSNEEHFREDASRRGAGSYETLR